LTSSDYTNLAEGREALRQVREELNRGCRGGGDAGREEA